MANQKKVGDQTKLKEQLKKGAIKRAQRDLLLAEEGMIEIEDGELSPGFTNAEDAIKWLNDKNRKYEK